MPAEPPYSGLTPDTVRDALASVGFAGDGRLLALNSYENRVYQVWLEGEETPSSPPSVVTKFYRPARWTDAQILEEHAFTLELADRKTLEWIGRFIGRIHAVGAVRPFADRPALDIESFGHEPRDWLLAHDFIPADLLDAWKSAAELALAGVARCYERAGGVRRLRLHGDCHAGNVLWTDAGPHFVDFDDCRSGPAIQDLWMLFSGDRPAMTRQLADVLAGYEDFHEFDPRELHLLEALRTLRLIHYSAWIARRWDDPAFPAAFPWFNTQRYWQDRILELKEQIALMEEAPLAVA